MWEVPGCYCAGAATSPSEDRAGVRREKTKRRLADRVSTGRYAVVCVTTAAALLVSPFSASGSASRTRAETRDKGISAAAATGTASFKSASTDEPRVPVPTLALSRASELLKAIECLKSLPVGWSPHDSDPPNKVAINTSRTVVNALVDINIIPAKVVPSAEGGVGIVIERGDRYANVECFNDGDVTAGFTDFASSPTVEFVEMTKSGLQTLGSHIREFLGL